MDFEDSFATDPDDAACCDAAADPSGAYLASTAYTLQDPTGAPVLPGDVLPNVITIGGPVANPFYITADEGVGAPSPGLYPDTVVVGGPLPGWVALDPSGQPIDPNDLLPNEVIIGGPSSAFEILDPQGRPVTPGEVLPNTVVVSGPLTGPQTNPLMVLTQAAAQSQHRVAAMEWEAANPGQPYPSDNGRPLAPAQVLLELMADPDATQADIARYRSHIERINAVISSTIEGMGRTE